jgi:HlyD family secretion protein
MEIRKQLLSRTTSLVAIVVVIAIAFGAWRFLDKPDIEAQYHSSPAKMGDVTQAVSANGTLNPVVLVNVGTQVSGTVKKLHVDFNDHVQAGQILLELDPALLTAQVRQDEANLNNAKASLELSELNEGRARTLWQQDSIAKQDFDTAVQAHKSAQAQVDQTAAQLAKDRTNLGYSVIRSPVAGVVVNRAVDLGQTVAASFQTPTLFQIAQDLRKMQIDSSFAEADIGNIKVGQPVQFTVDAFPDRTFNAAVRQVRLNPTTQQNVVTYDVVVAVDNPDQILMPGMTAYVSVVVARHKSALLVPNAALRFKPPEGVAEIVKGKATEDKAQGASGTVFVMEKQRLRAIPVRLGISDGKFTEVLSGDVKDGDPLVVGAAQTSAGQNQSTLRMKAF